MTPDLEPFVPHPGLGKVYLVGAGPGDPGLLTLKGKSLLEMAEVVVHDALISPEILAMINPRAEQINAGKRRGNHTLMQEVTTQLLIQKAQTHAVVVRLKGGDPFMFGRGGEEMQDLIRAGIAVEVVPGITSGIAAPAYAGIPLTHRDYSSSVTFVTGHEAAGKYHPKINWSAIAQGSETLVIYMGLHNLAVILEHLQAAGRSPETAIALIHWGTTPQQQVLVGSLDTILDQMQAAQLQTPAIAVIGNVVHLQTILPGLAGA
jgi:uroporphyrin-III C-methyltransferase